MARAPDSSGPDVHSIWRRVGLLILALGFLPATLLSCQRGPAASEPATLIYQGPQAYTLRPGDQLAGTDIRYVGRSGDGAEFSIGGQRATKQKADSLNWSGSPAAGVELVLRLRIAWFTDEALYAVGTAEVKVRDVAPQTGEASTQAPLSYQMPVAYTVEAGKTVPGTRLTYEGQEADGARFAGVDGYPYRQIGDSVKWEGCLRPNVWVRMDLRLLPYGDGSARLGGVAHLWVAPWP